MRKTALFIHLISVAAYLITFSCYASHIPGEPNAIDTHHNVPGTRPPDPNPRLRQHMESSLRQSPFEMDAEQRAIALDAIGEVCRHKLWRLLAAHVRSNHVHTIVDANDVAPEFVMNAFKSYASRALNLRSPMQKGRIRWARHGSTRYLWSKERLEAAMRYVLEKQGEPMACSRLPAP